MSENWDNYFLELCKTVGNNSKCLSRKIGAVLVKDKSIISTGYNGPPRGVSPCNIRVLKDPVLVNALFEHDVSERDVQTNNKCPRYMMDFKSGEGLEWCVAGHAERNTLINAARHGIATKGTTMYMDCNIPCTPCLVEIINAGVEEIVVRDMSYYDVSGEWLINESKLKVRVFDI